MRAMPSRHLVAACAGAPADPHFRAWKAGAQQFRHAVALEGVRVAARTVAPAGAHRRRGAGRIAAPGSRCGTGACRAPVSTTAARRLEAGLTRLEAEIARQILPDGGHINRSPEDLLHAYRLITMVMDALTAIQHPVSHELRSAHDRMAPMVRFFRHGDGALALFNGGHGRRSAHDRRSAGARRSARPAFRLCAPFRLSAHRRGTHSCSCMDCGTPPPGRFRPRRMPAACAFEFSTGTHRIVVNCGAAKDARQSKWDNALRVTAAHSTLTLADTSEGAILTQRLGARPAGTAIARRRERSGDQPRGDITRLVGERGARWLCRGVRRSARTRR